MVKFWYTECESDRAVPYKNRKSKSTPQFFFMPVSMGERSHALSTCFCYTYFRFLFFCHSASRRMLRLPMPEASRNLSGTARDFQPQFPPICGWNLSHCSLSSKIRRLLPHPTGRTLKTKRKICLKYIFKTEK